MLFGTTPLPNMATNLPYLAGLLIVFMLFGTMMGVGPLINAKPACDVSLMSAAHAPHTQCTAHTPCTSTLGALRGCCAHRVCATGEATRALLANEGTPSLPPQWLNGSFVVDDYCNDNQMWFSNCIKVRARNNPSYILL